MHTHKHHDADWLKAVTTEIDGLLAAANAQGMQGKHSQLALKYVIWH